MDNAIQEGKNFHSVNAKEGSSVWPHKWTVQRRDREADIPPPLHITILVTLSHSE